MIKKIKIGGFEVKNDDKLFLIAGPCVIENRDHALYHAKMIKQICDEISLNFVFKSSFDKANRTNINSSCLLYTSPSPRDRTRSRMPSSA